MISGLSKWSQELKRPAGKDDKDYIESKPIMCDCGGSTPIGDGSNVASFFYVDFEWICSSCGRVLEPTIRDYENNEQEL